MTAQLTKAELEALDASFSRAMGVLNNTGNHARPVPYVETPAAPIDSNTAALSFIFLGYEPGGATMDSVTALCDVLSMSRENVIARLGQLKERPALLGCLKKARLTGRAGQLVMAGLIIAA